METQAGAVAAGVPRQRLTFTYDSQHRRVRKVVENWDSTTQNWSVTTDRRFVYDGWNLIAEFEVNQQSQIAHLKSTYAWGLDLSGTTTGAGGVGGLVSVTEYDASGTAVRMLAPAYDNNGNVMAYADIATGMVTHRFEYDAFGIPLTVSYSDSTEAPPFRFSTKYLDGETGLYYYGYRYYSPEMGRWLNRDPIEEQGGINLYAMVGNNPINIIDKDGRTGWQINGPWDHDYFDPKIKIEDPFLEGFVSWFVGNGRGAVTWLALSGALGPEKENDYEFRTWVIKEVANAVQKELRSNPDARDLCAAEIKVYAKGHWEQITGRLAAGLTVSITLTSATGSKLGGAAGTTMSVNALIGDVYHQAGRVTGALTENGITQQQAKREFETKMQDGQAALKAYIDFLKAAATGNGQ